MTVAEPDPAVSALDNQLTAIGARDEAGDVDGECLGDGREKVFTFALEADGEPSLTPNDPDVGAAWPDGARLTPLHIYGPHPAAGAGLSWDCGVIAE
jgi:hypothetical protein